MKFIHLFSGGLDSTVLLYDLLDQEALVHCLLFNYGQRHLRELDYAEGTCHKLKVPYDRVAIGTKLFFSRSTLTGQKGELEGKATIVPNRNMVMLSLAARPQCGRDLDADRLRILAGWKSHAPYIQSSKKEAGARCPSRCLMWFAPLLLGEVPAAFVVLGLPVPRAEGA